MQEQQATAASTAATATTTTAATPKFSPSYLYPQGCRKHPSHVPTAVVKTATKATATTKAAAATGQR